MDLLFSIPLTFVASHAIISVSTVLLTRFFFS
jgi:hypothetical protein